MDASALSAGSVGQESMVMVGDSISQGQLPSILQEPAPSQHRDIPGGPGPPEHGSWQSSAYGRTIPRAMTMTLLIALEMALPSAPREAPAPAPPRGQGTRMEEQLQLRSLKS